MSMEDEPYLIKKMEDDLYREAKEERERIKKEMESYSTLTKRELFAAMAMQAHVTNGDYAYGREPGEEYEDSMIRASIRIADKLIKGLEGK